MSNATISKHAEAAKAILLRSGQKSGFCYVVGAERGRLAYELARRSDLRIVGIEPNAEKAAAARAALGRAGMFGSRIVIVHGNPKQTPFSNYFANLVVSDTLLLTGKLPCEPADVGRHVKPCGGMVYFGTSVQPSNTCAYYDWYYSFDSTTDGGKSALSILLAAKTTGAAVDLWYADSTAPGTNQTGGCTTSALSVMNAIAIK